MEKPITLTFEKSPCSGKRIYTVRISEEAFMKASLQLDAMERRMVGDRVESISDALIALEVLVRKIERIEAEKAAATTSGKD